MRLSKRFGAYLKKVSPFYLFLIAVSPLFISLFFHLMILVYANHVTWNWGTTLENADDDGIPAAIIQDGKTDDRLKFQGMDMKDSFEADEQMSQPVPEIEYRAVVPEMEVLPSPKASDELDIISVQAAAMDTQWVNPATGGQPLHTGPEMLVGSFSRHIKVMREGGLDVVFVFDSTASMSGYLKEVKAKIKKLAAAFRKLVPTCRIGLVTYRDKQDEYLTKQYPLTYGVINLHDFLIDISYGGGFDVREAVTDGLKEAIENMNWNNKSKKFILLIGDAPPHLEDMGEAVSLVRKFRNTMGGKVSALDIRQPKNITKYYWTTVVLPNITDPDIESFEYLTDTQGVMKDFRIISEAGGGECARLIDEEKVIKNMLLLIFGTRWEMYLNEFMKNL
jgi:hypothetical protein